MYAYGEDILALNSIVIYIMIQSVVKNRNIKQKKIKSVILSLIISFISLQIIALCPMDKTPSFSGIMISFLIPIAMARKPFLRNLIIDGVYFIICSLITAGTILLMLLLFKGGERAFSYMPKADFLTVLLASFTAREIFAFLCGAIKPLSHLDRLLKQAVICLPGEEERRVTLLADTGNMVKTEEGRFVVMIKEELVMDLTGAERAVFEGYEQFGEAYEKLERKEGIGLIKIKDIYRHSYSMLVRGVVMEMEGKVFDNVYIAAGRFTGAYDGVYNPLMEINR